MIVTESGSSKVYYLSVILNDIANIRLFTDGCDQNSYGSDTRIRYATERALLNISEAVRNLETHGRRDNPTFQLSSLSDQIPWQSIKGIGNILRHDYDTVSNARIWNVIQDKLDDLEQACQRALKDGEPR
jgi:uncharacterized protein with HEPN domain